MPGRRALPASCVIMSRKRKNCRSAASWRSTPMTRSFPWKKSRFIPDPTGAALRFIIILAGMAALLPKALLPAAAQMLPAALPRGFAVKQLSMPCRCPAAALMSAIWRATTSSTPPIRALQYYNDREREKISRKADSQRQSGHCLRI